MKNIIRIALVCSILISTAFAEELEIKINGKNIKLPYWSAAKNPHGAVVLVNGGAQPHWSMLLAYLAKQLALHGWSAALLNCTSDGSETWAKELPETINALRQQKINRIILLHYGEQLQQTFDAFNKKGGIEGLVLLSAYELSKPDDKKAELRMPLLDVVGQFDYGLVLEQQRAREKEFAQNRYTALKIPGANHDYEYNRQLLLSHMYGWMKKLDELQPKSPPVLVSYLEPVVSLISSEVAWDEDQDWSGFNANPAEPTQEITPP